MRIRYTYNKKNYKIFYIIFLMLFCPVIYYM